MTDTQVIRIDDISPNTNIEELFDIVQLIHNKWPDRHILLGISPLAHDMRSEKGKTAERIFPKILNAYSDHKHFFQVRRAWVPNEFILKHLGRLSSDRVKIASHGLVHVDHRLLSFEAQQLSIVTSCSLVDSTIFIPPFNKWNEDTETICAQSGFELIKFEDGWHHLMYIKFPVENQLDRIYFHAHEIDMPKLAQILEKL